MSHIRGRSLKVRGARCNVDLLGEYILQTVVDALNVLWREVVEAGLLATLKGHLYRCMNRDTDHQKRRVFNCHMYRKIEQ